MMVRALDQLHVSSVRSSVLHKGEEFEISDHQGKLLVERGLVAAIDGEKAEPKPDNKMAPAPRNKKKRAPAAKAAPAASAD